MASDAQRAHGAVAYAIRQQRLPAATTLPCADCGDTAVDYHHWRGYQEAHHLDVLPLCHPCHALRHERRGRLLPELRRWRDRRAMTQVELAQEAGVAEATVSRLETGRFAARPKTVKALAGALGVEPAALYAAGED